MRTGTWPGTSYDDANDLVKCNQFASYLSDTAITFIIAYAGLDAPTRNLSLVDFPRVHCQSSFLLVALVRMNAVQIYTSAKICVCVRTDNCGNNSCDCAE